MNAIPTIHEPLRFGMTGNFWLSDMRADCAFRDPAVSGGLDAPCYVARGSTKGHLMAATQYTSASHYVSFTDPRRQW